MGSFKTAAPCEVCGFRVSHHGQDAGFVVGCRATGIPRLVHNRCRHGWVERRTGIMAKWPELRANVLRTLDDKIRHRIVRYRDQQGEGMPRSLNRERHVFPSAVTEEIRRVLVQGDTRKGAIKTLYEKLQRAFPESMPSVGSATGYADFYHHWNVTKDHLKWEQERVTVSPPSTDVPIGPEVATPAASVTPAIDSDELSHMARTAHALVDLAVARRDREGVQFVLEALGYLLSKPKS